MSMVHSSLIYRLLFLPSRGFNLGFPISRWSMPGKTPNDEGVMRPLNLKIQSNAESLIRHSVDADHFKTWFSPTPRGILGVLY